jgi:hypothetical protein
MNAVSRFIAGSTRAFAWAIASYRTAGLVLVCAINAPLFAQQHCDTQIYPLSSPTARFQDNGDGTVTDTGSRLMWMRCSTGQTWSAGSCNGVAASLTWESAAAAAQEVNDKGAYFYKDWRLPQIRELATITERQCADPRVNLTVFPGTPAAFYWTASSRAVQGSEPAAFVLSFGSDGVRYDSKSEAHQLRLVRSAQ